MRNTHRTSTAVSERVVLAICCACLILIHFAGPAKFNIEEEAKLSFIWDNTHSWIRSKTVNFAINYYPADDTAMADASTGKPTI